MKWKKFASWDLGRGEQVIWTAFGEEDEYKITRQGTADKPLWTLYTRDKVGVEEAVAWSDRLREVKAYADLIERGDEWMDWSRV